MVYSGKEIEKRIGREIVIDPYNPAQLNPNSYNLRLHDKLLYYTAPTLDMKRDNPTAELTIPPEGLQLEPGRLYLGRTMEYTETHNAVPMLEGRSSVGRLGLFIHVTAGFGDVGFCGYWTLEIFCVQPIVVYPDVEICQIYYHQISPDHTEYRSGKYQNNRDIQASMLWRDFTGSASRSAQGAPEHRADVNVEIDGSEHPGGK
jgi:dCTP deaminase